MTYLESAGHSGPVYTVVLVQRSGAIQFVKVGLTDAFVASAGDIAPAALIAHTVEVDGRVQALDGTVVLLNPDQVASISVIPRDLPAVATVHWLAPRAYRDAQSHPLPTPVEDRQIGAH